MSYFGCADQKQHLRHDTRLRTEEGWNPSKVVVG